MYWTQEEISFLDQHLEDMSLRELATALRRSEKAVKLFLFRRKSARPGVSGTRRNLLQHLIACRFIRPEWFTPNREFYQLCQISQKRYWDVYRGNSSLTPEEYQRISKVLFVTLDNAFEHRQLNLFKDDNKGDN